MSAHSEIRKEDKNNYCYAVFIGAVFIIGMKLLTLSEPKEQKKGRGKLDRNAKCYSSSFLLNLVVSHFKNGSVAFAASVAYSQTADFNADAHTCLLTLGFIASSTKCLSLYLLILHILKFLGTKERMGARRNQPGQHSRRQEGERQGRPGRGRPHRLQGQPKVRGSHESGPGIGI